MSGRVVTQPGIYLCDGRFEMTGWNERDAAEYLVKILHRVQMKVFDF